MILSIHTPKTAGTTFLDYLRRAFGARLLLDYGDLPELERPEDIERRRARRADLLSRATDIERNIDVIHGHYLPAKYEGLFAESRCLTFVRDPYQHAMSTYLHASRNTSNTPGLDYFRKSGTNVMDLVKSFPDHQSFYLSGQTIDEFALVGVTEQFDRSIALFRAIFGLTAPWDGIRHNVNPDRPATAVYEISGDLRRAVDTYRERDVVLYRKANERLAELARRHGI